MKGPTLVICVAIVKEDDRRFLLSQRNYPGNLHHGKWEFPGGKVEYMERPEDTAIREIREELGLEIAVTQMLPLLVSTSWLDHHVILACYLGRIIGGVLMLDSHTSDVSWLTIAEIETKASNSETMPSTLHFAKLVEDYGYKALLAPMEK